MRPVWSRAHSPRCICNRRGRSRQPTSTKPSSPVPHSSRLTGSVSPSPGLPPVSTLHYPRYRHSCHPGTVRHTCHRCRGNRRLQIDPCRISTHLETPLGSAADKCQSISRRQEIAILGKTRTDVVNIALVKDAIWTYPLIRTNVRSRQRKTAVGRRHQNIKSGHQAVHGVNRLRAIDIPNRFSRCSQTDEVG